MTDSSSDSGDHPGVRVVEDGGRSLLTRIFGALSHPRRRYVVYYLRDKDEATVAELARVVVAWERGIPREDATEDALEPVKTDLVHTHLPKLEDFRVVEYDPRSETVCYTHRPKVLDDVVDLAVTIESPPWSD